MITASAIEQGFDVQVIRRQFPALNREVKGKPLVYFDNAATTQKPQVVIDALVNYYSNYNANIHRGIHTLAEEATAAYEGTRDTVKEFINAPSREQIIFFIPGIKQGKLVNNLVLYFFYRFLLSHLQQHFNGFFQACY